MMSVSDRYSSGTPLEITGAAARPAASGNAIIHARRARIPRSSSNLNVLPGITAASQSLRNAKHETRANARAPDERWKARYENGPLGVVEIAEIFDVGG